MAVIFDLDICMDFATTVNSVDLWEAWVDLQSPGGAYTLYVVGDVCTGSSKSKPVLKRKYVQGMPAAHLVLEILPCFTAFEGHFSEVRYAESIHDPSKYEKIFICVGEDVIARIGEIEILH